MKYIFYLESYIFLFIKEEDILLYNSNSGMNLKFCSSKTLINILNPLLNLENMYSIYITKDEYSNQEISHFINTVRDAFWGDLIPVSLVKNKPIIFPPILNFQKKKDRNDYSSSDNIMNLITNLNLYINDKSTINNRLASKKSYKQYTSCIDGNSDEIISFEILNNIVKEIEVLNICINILGGNILLYPQIKDLQILLSRFKRVNYYLYFIDFYDAILNKIALDKKINYCILVDDSISESILATINNYILKNSINISWNFFIESEKEFDSLELLIEKNSITNYELFPLLTDNISFFEDNIFIDEEELSTNIISKREIFAHQTINTTDFGKITIFPDKSVYGNVNLPSIGNISITSLHELVHKELKVGESWFRIRDNEPCINCIYQWLCPTPTNFELILCKANTCKIK